MKYHQWPNRYNWSNMPYDVGTYETQRLIQDIGSSVNMQYSSNGSSPPWLANPEANAFDRDYGYNAVLKGYLTHEVRTEVGVNRRPVYMAGDDLSKGSGHAWVCEGTQEGGYDYEYFIEFNMPSGYMDVGGGFYNPMTSSGPYFGYLYMNWGWGYDKGNGWYNNDNVASPSGNYQSNRQTIYVSPKR